MYRIHILESRNRRAHSIDILVACVNPLIALASESTLQSPIERPRGKVAKGKKRHKSCPPLNVCKKTKPRFEKDWCTFLQNTIYTKGARFVPVSY